MGTTRRLPPETWIEQIFSAKAVSKGAVVRRSVALIEREVGRRRFETEVANRGFHLLECGGQFVVVCNRDEIKIIR